MAFRTVEISHPAELHVQQNQLIVIQESGTVRIPLDDIIHITCLGPNIRLSTLALSKLNESGITLLVIDESYHASSIAIPVKGYSRQAMVIHKQIEFINSMKSKHLWLDIIRQKIKNQREVLAILGLGGIEYFDAILGELNIQNVDECEAKAAKGYFQILSPGLNRRNETPFNSKLNYGYAVLRNSIIRSLVNKGFQPAIGIHHSNQLNAFNLADDLIEPFRPMVDLAAIHSKGDSLSLDKEERRTMANVLHSYCEFDGKKEKVVECIDHTIENLRAFIIQNSEHQLCEFTLPKVIAQEVVLKVEE